MYQIKEASSGGQPYRPAVATMSLGKAGLHSLDKKIEAASSRGFQGIELFWDDLEVYAQNWALSCPASLFPVAEDSCAIVLAAKAVRKLCDRLDIKVVSLQPFRNYDGILDDELHAARIQEFKVWLRVAAEVGADMIGVPSTIERNDETYTGNRDMMAADLAELAGLAKPYGIRVAYENLCFAAHIRSWSQAWDVISRTGDVEAIGFLLDTFNICGDVFANPTIERGQEAGASERLRQSLQEFVMTVPMSSIPLLQVADAELMNPPISPDHPWMEGCWNAKMAWSRNGRLFPFEKGGYLPTTVVIEALVSAGWSGWVSLEVFSRTTAKPGPETIWEHADRAWVSWEKLAKTMGWDVRPERVKTGEDVAAGNTLKVSMEVKGFVRTPEILS